MQRKEVNPLQQQQIAKGSGSIYHVNLDRITAQDLNGCQQLLTDHGFSLSNSLVVRRAVRSYLQRLKRLTTGPAIRNELVEVQRAAKGIA